MKKILLMTILILTTACSFQKEIYIGGIEEIVEIKQEVELRENIGLKSSVENPLRLGQTGLASKKSTILDDYQTVDITLNLVLLEGNEAAFASLAEKDETLTRKTGFRLIVLEYETDLINFETETFGTDGLVFAEIQGTDDNPLLYNGVKQLIEYNVLEKEVSKFKNETAKVRLIFQVPIDTESFLIKLGAANKERAFFRVG